MKVEKSLFYIELGEKLSHLKKKIRTFSVHVTLQIRIEILFKEFFNDALTTYNINIKIF